MESNVGNESDIILKQWDTTSISIGKDMPVHWGISKENITLALDILKDNQIEIINNEKISFKAFRFLCRFLYNNKIDPEDINSALGKYRESFQEVIIGDKLILELQQTIQSLFSPLSPAPYTLTADGKWGPHSVAALKYVTVNYVIVNTEINSELLRTLQSVSGRIIRVACHDDMLIERSEYNPFCIIDNKGEDFELIPKGNGAAIVDKKNNLDLVNFHSFLANDRRGLNAFNQFSAWLMLLKMGSGNFEKVGRLSLRDKDDQWIDFSKLQTTNEETFFIKPDYYLSISDFHANIPVLFSSPGEEAIDIIGIYFSGDFKFTISYGYDTDAPPGKEGKARLLDSESFYRSYEYLQNKDANAYPLHKADFLKIFIVKKGLLENIPNDIGYQGFPGVDASFYFYRLITANESDIYADYTIALSFNENEKDKKTAFSSGETVQDNTVTYPFNNKWILVAGSATEKLSMQEELMSKAIGRICAQQGFGLICGGYSGVDGTVLSAFKTALQEYNISAEGRTIQLRTDTDKFIPADSKQRPTAAFYSSLFRDDAGGIEGVVLIGGSTGTDRINRQAQTRSTPVIPVPFTGGVANSIFNDLLASNKKLVTNDLLKVVDKAIESETDAVQIAKSIISWIDDLKTGVQEKKFSKEELFHNIENKPASLLPFKNKWVLVAGTGSSELSKEEQLMVEALCGQCAAKGYGIICGGWPGVDELVATTFTAYMDKGDIQDKNRLIQVLGQTHKPNSDYGKVEWVLNDEEWYSKCLDKAMAVVLIGGLGGTYDAFKKADKRSIPVIPVPATAGDAREAYHVLFSKEELPYSHELFTNLDMELDTVREADVIANNIIDILTELDSDINIFISYSHEDKKMCDDLIKHLAPLQRDKKINIWHDDLMAIGTDWNKEIIEQIKKSNIILLLISVDFLASQYIFDESLKIALEKAKSGEAILVPVILRPCEWDSTPYYRFKALPHSPITTFENKEEAYLELVEGIRQIIDKKRNLDIIKNRKKKIPAKKIISKQRPPKK